jgi:hypothetical protein
MSLLTSTSLAHNVTEEGFHGTVQVVGIYPDQILFDGTPDRLAERDTLSEI